MRGVFHVRFERIRTHSVDTRGQRPAGGESATPVGHDPQNSLQLARTDQYRQGSRLHQEYRFSTDIDAGHEGQRRRQGVRAFSVATARGTTNRRTTVIDFIITILNIVWGT